MNGEDFTLLANSDGKPRESSGLSDVCQKQYQGCDWQV